MEDLVILHDANVWNTENCTTSEHSDEVCSCSVCPSSQIHEEYKTKQDCCKRESGKERGQGSECAYTQYKEP